MSTIVVDANITLALVVPLKYSNQAEEQFQRWSSKGMQFAAPALWGYEVVSALRKAVAAEVLAEGEADRAVRDIWALGVEEIAGTIEGHRRALAWSMRLGQTAAYDAQYLVVAEDLEAQMWTADRRLFRAAKAAGVDWMHWVGETA
ncbi:MAG: type II toxin-antitoxin system VapC family toxin [Anaerolineales bacterium]|nr:type II toxin-antitoxin system VapC family toxin [Anaerolineales bacterium]